MLLTEYKIINNKPILYSYGRHSNGEKYCNTITDFKPYFYVEKGQEYIYRNDERVNEVIDNGYKEIYGKNVVKIVVNNLYDIRELRDLVEQSYEADVDYVTKYTIDELGELEKEPIATCFIDIETDHGKGFPKPRQAAYPITAITCYNTLIGKMITFGWRKDLTNSIEKNTRYLKKEKLSYEDTTMIFDNERDMLNNFLTYIEDTDPDIFSAWNISFDFGYIIQRLYNIAMNYNRLSPMGIVIKKPNRMNKDNDDISIKGRIVFDLLTAYKRMNFKGLPSYKLDNVAEKELGSNKIEYEGTLANLWRTDFEHFIEYNKIDVELLIRLDYKRKIIESNDEIRRMAKCKFEDLFESTKVTDAFILRYCKNKGIVLPSKGFHSKEKFGGAIVLTPIKGLHEYVSICDFASLYPKIISCLNCSPETLTTIKTNDTVNLNIPYLDIIKMEAEISVKSHRTLLIKDFAQFTEDNWNIEEQTFKCPILDKFKPYMSYKKIHYKQDKKGILPEIMEYLFDKRLEMKKTRDTFEYSSEEYEFYERKQYAFKVTMNSFYGVVSYKGFRLYTPEIGASITYIGRNAILWSKRIVEDMEMLK